MALFLLTLRGLFPQEIHRRVVQVVVGALAAACVAVLVLPTGVFSYLALPGQAIAVVVAVYVAAAMLRARRRAPVDVTVLLAGMLEMVNLGTMGLHWASRQCRSVERDALTAPVEALERRIVGLREHLRNARIESA